MSLRRERKQFERELRRLRPEPRREHVATIVSTLAPAPRRRPAGRPRVVFAGALTAGLVVALGSVGGIGYAASAAQQAATTVKHVFVPSSRKAVVVVSGLSAGGDQYRPGYGWGDRNHNHTGPPGLRRKGGAFAPPLLAVPTDRGIAAIAKTAFTIDEQSHLYITVIDRRGTELLLTQHSKRGGSTVGKGVTGPQTKVIQYLVLVPRSIPISLRVPGNLLAQGQTYRIRIIARDPQGNRSVAYIPFRG
ncbi:MAG TPA: hypothetical protein VLN26_09415 [Gaiellaceae bacterium]|nr:hypothetical protein [Gaiellaceae bacterium]